MFTETFVTALSALLGASISVCLAFLTGRRNKRAREAEDQFRAHYEELTELANQRRAQLTGEGDTGADVLGGTQQQELALLSSRVDGLESRLPNGAILDKLASVNDAILATRLDELSRRLDRLEADAMTPGKVANIVFAIMAVYLALAAVLPWVLQMAVGS